MISSVMMFFQLRQKKASTQNRRVADDWSKMNRGPSEISGVPVRLTAVVSCIQQYDGGIPQLWVVLRVRHVKLAMWLQPYRVGLAQLPRARLSRPREPQT